MTHTDEALARIAVAQLEARRLRKKSEELSRQWRFVSIVTRIVLAGVLAVLMQVMHWQISGTQACSFFLIYIAASALHEYRTTEALHKLQAELDQLKDGLKGDSA